MGSVKQFNHDIFRQYEQQKLMDKAFAEGGKAFADKLNAAREEDAKEFLAQARSSIAGLSNEDARMTMTVLAINKLFDVGYREFAGLFKEVLKRGE